MDSLIANYASDDEDDEVQVQPANAKKPPSLSSSLTPPQFPHPSPEGPPGRLNRGSLFASLPPPKLTNTAPLPEKRPADHHDARVGWTNDQRASAPDSNQDGSSQGYGSYNGRFEADDSSITSTSKNSGVHDGFFREGVHGAAAPSADTDRQQNARTSLFSALPPPKSTGSSLFSALPPPKSTGSSLADHLPAPAKRVVQFRPSINKALLEDPEDDEPHVKRKHMDSASGHSGKPSGLSAILPPPKNVGAVLGAGSAGGGRRAALETATDDKTNHQQAAAVDFQESERAPDVGDLTSTPMSDWNATTAGGQIDHYPGSFSQENMEGYTSQGYDETSFYQSQNVADLSTSDGFHSTDYYESPGISMQESASSFVMTSTPDPLANILEKEKRRGGKDAVPNFIEVKQADLTAKRMREDQLRTTGIAFGPAYRPVSSNKDKPSKLHRRKHQIGSLYFDMKQKEMELLERRAKGNLTKSETQAKYGW